MTIHGTREGNGRTLAYDFETKRRALQWVGQTLYDNNLATKADAQRFAATVTLDGTPASYGPYTFTLSKVPSPTTTTSRQW